jgi:hypothetical protein
MPCLGLPTARPYTRASTSPLVELLEGVASGVGLSQTLGNGPAARRPIDGERGPPGSVLVAEVDKQGVRPGVGGRTSLPPPSAWPLSLLPA